MNNQISMFETINTENLLSPERQTFREALRSGSGFVDGRERIRQMATTLSKEDFIDALKKEYGTGGRSGPNMTRIWFDGKGFYVNKWEDNEQKYTWTQVANEILDMIETNSY